MIEANGLSIPPRPCEVPCPIVMSNNRYGCGLHFFKKYTAAIAFVRNEHGEFTLKNQHQNKQFHANLTFDRWIKKESKSIFSSRTGISHNSRYIVCNSNHKSRPGRTHIYHKLMNNFQITPSPNLRTARKQKIRYERSCRRILSQEVIKPGAISSTSTKLAAAKKGRFLFLPSQKFTTPLKHLRYKKTVDIPKQKDYNFTIPHYFSTNTNVTSRPMATKNISIATATTSALVSNDELVYTVTPYNPVPDMFIPIKYRDIIPPDSIYDNFGSFIVPGSREWFTYMYQLDLDTHDERLRKADDAKFAARIDELNAASEASKLSYQQYLEERSKEITDLIIQEDIRIQNLARYHGTNPKHVKYRQRQASDYTRWNNTYHNSMINPQRITSSNKKKSKKKKLLQSEMDSFLINYPNVSLSFSLKCDTTRSRFDYKDNILPTEPYTSDDTKEIETRPSKRDDHNFDNNSRSHGTSKRSRLNTSLALDSEQAGSSK
ncbi:15202_t:CDS:1 [Rhizophagus irregularis]|nr:15202_t:CDS:1 [Rhizophagus irregularis]